MNLIDWIARFYSLILLIRVLLSWVSPDHFNPIVQFLYRVTDPLLNRIRSLIPLRWAMIDFSPIIAFLLIELVRRILIQMLVRLL
ncbi:MAG: YggT family protein [Chlamydiae bacterium]|nr:YggT family protein [Chlamydiota bacterium]MBI3276352.1 YggT family protein [Chlamydiota bacterium]